MIEDKKIIITKDNIFDKGWALFYPFDLSINNNSLYKQTLVTDIIRLITYSNEVNLILCDMCLSSRIVEEIKWANKYIKLNIIAKDSSIIEHYKKLSFSSKKIDHNIDFNYIGISGKESGHYIIADDYTEIDESIYKVYFQGKNLKGDLAFLKNVKELIIIDENGEKKYLDVINNSRNNNTQCFYVNNTKNFNKKIFEFSKENKLDLLVSQYTKNGIIALNQDKTLSFIVKTPGDFFLSYPIKNITPYIGELYKSEFYDERIDVNKIQKNVYSCLDGKLQKLNIAEKKTISIKIKMDLMSNYISEIFDSSIVNNHNDYSAEAKKVEYQFTLIPPLFNSEYSRSKIYDGINSLHLKWNNNQTLKVKAISEDYSCFMDKDFGLLGFIQKAEKFTSEFNKRVELCDYKNYYNWIKESINLYDKMQKGLLNICKEMFSSINEASSDNRFNKIDDEIIGYEQIIKEKDSLIQKGVDILNNKRRVEILTSKIKDLQELKKQFEKNSNTRNDKNLNVFVNRCIELLEGKHKNINDDSIGNIVKPKEATKLAKLETFLEKYLFLIKNYIDECLYILIDLMNESIPEDYVVFDKGGQRYIIIDDLSEYKTTKSICNKFKLDCIVRR